MRILLASFWGLPFTGGIWTYVKELRAALQRMGHDVEVFSSHPDEPSFHLLEQGVKMAKEEVRPHIRKRVDRFYRRLGIPPDPTVRHFEIERYCFEAAAAHFGLESYDLIHAQDTLSARALQRVKPDHVPLVATIHGALPNEFNLQGRIDCERSMRWQYLIAQDRLGAAAAAITITPSQWMREFYTSVIGVPPEQMTVIPYGLDIDAFACRMEELPSEQAPTGVTTMICPARYDRVKGHAVLLEALARLRQTRTDWVCWLAGDGGLRKRLQLQCDRLGLGAFVQFLGTRQDIPALLKQADFVVLPSLQDNLPFALMEAQLAGKAIISTHTGGIPEIVQHGQTGLLSAAGDVEGLRHHLEMFVSDASLRQRLSDNAAQLGRERWDAQAMIERTLQVYESAKGWTT